MGNVLIQAGTYETSCNSGTATVHVPHAITTNDWKLSVKELEKGKQCYSQSNAS